MTELNERALVHAVIDASRQRGESDRSIAHSNPSENMTYSCDIYYTGDIGKLMRISITDVQSMSSTNRSQIARTKASQRKWHHIAVQDLKDETGMTVTPDFKKGTQLLFWAAGAA
jgi:hypothetical protein